MNTKFLFNFATKQNYLFEQSKNQKFFFSLLIEINFKTKSYTSKSDVIYHIEAKLIDKLHIFQLSFYITLETSIFLNVRENCKQKLKCKRPAHSIIRKHFSNRNSRLNIGYLS